MERRRRRRAVSSAASAVSAAAVSPPPPPPPPPMPFNPNQPPPPGLDDPHSGAAAEGNEEKRRRRRHCKTEKRKKRTLTKEKRNYKKNLIFFLSFHFPSSSLPVSLLHDSDAFIASSGTCTFLSRRNAGPYCSRPRRAARRAGRCPCFFEKFGPRFFSFVGFLFRFLSAKEKKRKHPVLSSSAFLPPSPRPYLGTGRRRALRVDRALGHRPGLSLGAARLLLFVLFRLSSSSKGEEERGAEMRAEDEKTNGRTKREERGSCSYSCSLSLSPRPPASSSFLLLLLLVLLLLSRPPSSSSHQRKKTTHVVDLLKQLLQRGVVPRRQHPGGALVLSQVLGQGRVGERGLAEGATGRRRCRRRAGRRGPRLTFLFFWLAAARGTWREWARKKK